MVIFGISVGTVWKFQLSQIEIISSISEAVQCQPVATWSVLQFTSQFRAQYKVAGNICNLTDPSLTARPKTKKIGDFTVSSVSRHSGVFNHSPSQNRETEFSVREQVFQLNSDTNKFLEI